jgi:hypothetical protein
LSKKTDLTPPEPDPIGDAEPIIDEPYSYLQGRKFGQFILGCWHEACEEVDEKYEPLSGPALVAILSHWVANRGPDLRKYR